MSKTIRISEELYNVIDDHRQKNQTFQDVIEEMAEDIGLLPAKIKDLDDLRNKLKNLYGYDSLEISRVLEALQTVYIGQEKESTIGIAHEDIEKEYKSEIDTLQRLGLVQEKHYTGKYDYGYRTTSVGDKIGSEQIRKYIDEYEDEIQAILNSYDKEELSVIVNLGFEKTDTGHLATREADLAVSYKDSLLDNEIIQDRYQEFKRQLLDVGIAVKHSEGHFTVLPPEFADYLRTLNSEQTEALRKIEIYKAIKSYAVKNLDTRSELLDRLETADEENLEEVLTDLHQDGLTSRYIRRDEAPFLVKDKDRLLDRLRRDVEAAVTNE